MYYCPYSYRFILPYQINTENFIMEQTTKTPNRKKFLIWGATLLSSLTILKFLPGNKKHLNVPAGRTVKMLTQDGKLVEVDIENISCGKRKKVSDDQLKTWVNSKQNNVNG